jgi:hypothetical protein
MNEDFQGPLSHQIGTSFWFSFSTMVFAHSNFASPFEFIVLKALQSQTLT